MHSDNPFGIAGELGRSPEGVNMKKAGVIIAVAFTCIIMGGFIGAFTNMINGAISSLYFQNIMRWHDIQNVWRAAVAQGIFEGLIYGILFAAVFTAVFGVVTKGDCKYSKVLTFMLGIFLAVLGCWALGGLIAMGLAILSPEFYRQAFIGVPEETVPMLRYAWVGGSIWGVMFGGLLSAILGSVIFRIKWKKNLVP
jgi:hypothetical protein